MSLSIDFITFGDPASRSLVPLFALDIHSSHYAIRAFHARKCLFTLVDRTNAKTRCRFAGLDDPERGATARLTSRIDRMISKWKRTSTRPA